MTVAGKRYVDCTVLGTGSTADAEDSSYDSDYEAEDSIGSTSVHSQLELQVSSSSHTDVSRTTSDTLAAEYEEYVTVQEASASQSPGYAARVEFALKLGYTERLVQAALQKLGPDPGQNELLAELIKLGANCSGKIIENSEENEEIELEEEEESGSTSTSGLLRPIVIDGSNVAMSHGNKEIFSCRGIKICVDWFKARGHTEITVFVPKWRKEASRLDNPIADQEILGELEKDRLLVFTPSRLVGGKRMVCYDDRYILRLAAEVDGVVVSNDNYRDLAQENPEFRKVVEERILMYSFVNDRFMPPDDPLGRSGPTLENFLRVSTKKTDTSAPPCPYAKKCTYGNKCKFRHPERGSHPQKSVTERLVEHAQKHLQARGPSLSLPLPGTASNHQPLCKTRSAIPNSTSQSFSSVTKSKSVENVTSEQQTPVSSQISSQISSQSSGSTSCGAGVSSQQGSHQVSLGYRSSVRSPGRSSNSEPEAVNLHRKLQRQLTLNPACDPRLYRLRRYHQQQSTQQSSTCSSSSSSHPGISPQPVQHRPLTRHGSAESSYTLPINWDHHESLPAHPHVTRIASAPDSYQPWPSGSTAVPNSLSDPQLNMPSWMLSRFLDTRTRIHYHLAHIFPEEHVRTAMAIHPFETDPKRICAALLKMERP